MSPSSLQRIAATDIPKTEFSETFIEAMRARTAVSFFKYGPLAEAVARRADFLTALKTRLRLYEETGNTEWLIDVANYAMFEHLYPAHRAAHFRATDGAESPGQAPERRRGAVPPFFSHSRKEPA